ncbi:hypothetical protein PINS_up003252 [Pythium insidiosum]|nr:hypothetical protein PINS_up003252 [Pythium insidiosum]
MNGERHKFCEFHRRKANLNQRRWQQRRQRQRKEHLVTMAPSRVLNENSMSNGAYSDDDATQPQSPDLHHRPLHHHHHHHHHHHPPSQPQPQPQSQSHPHPHPHPQLHHAQQHVQHGESPAQAPWRHPLHAPLTSHLPERHQMLPHAFPRPPQSPPRSASFPPSKGFLPSFGLGSMPSRHMPPPPLMHRHNSPHDIPPFPSTLEHPHPHPHPHRLGRSHSVSSTSPTRMHPYAPSPLRPSLKAEPGQPQVLPRLPALAHVVQGAKSTSVRQLPPSIGVSPSPEEVASTTKQFMF